MPNRNSPENVSPFDRLAGPRRNRKLRNYFTICGVASAFFAVVTWFDARVSGEALPEIALYVLIGLFILSSALAVIYHLKFLTRE